MKQIYRNLIHQSYKHSKETTNYTKAKISNVGKDSEGGILSENPAIRNQELTLYILLHDRILYNEIMDPLPKGEPSWQSSHQKIRHLDRQNPTINIPYKLSLNIQCTIFSHERTYKTKQWIPLPTNETSWQEQPAKNSVS